MTPLALPSHPMGWLNYSLLCIYLVATFPLNKACFNNCCEPVKLRLLQGDYASLSAALCRLQVVYSYLSGMRLLREKKKATSSEYNPLPNLPDHH